MFLHQMVVFHQPDDENTYPSGTGRKYNICYKVRKGINGSQFNQSKIFYGRIVKESFTVL